MENIKDSFTVVCLEENTTEVNIGIYTFKTEEGVSAFVKGRKLGLDQYAVINGPVIKQMYDVKTNFPKEE
jgi:hypothetical protein